MFHKELLLKERIRSLWEQILSFKRSAYFGKGTQLKIISACSSSLPLMCVTFSAFWLRHWSCLLKEKIITALLLAYNKAGLRKTLSDMNVFYGELYLVCVNFLQQPDLIPSSTHL